MHHMEQIEDRNLAAVEPLVSPRAVKTRRPLTAAAAAVVLGARRAIRDVLHGRDRRRLVVIVGPCSIHDPEAALDYAARPAAESPATRATQLLIVMRVYFEKPRTTVGWKGLINDPHLDGSFDIATACGCARQLLLDIAELGLPAATELLDPIVAAVHRRPGRAGPRSARAPPRARRTARWRAASRCRSASRTAPTAACRSRVDAMLAARHPHHFLGIDQDGAVAVMRTAGNRDATSSCAAARAAQLRRRPVDIGRAAALAAGEADRAADRSTARTPTAQRPHAPARVVATSPAQVRRRRSRASWA